MFSRKRFSLIIALVFALVLGGYWIKCQSNINLVDGFHLGDYLPVGFMQIKHRPPQRSHPGQLLLRESFDAPFWNSDWGVFWAREPGQVTYEVSREGGLSSRCLIVESRSVKDWTWPQPVLVEVKPGEVFSMSAVGKVSGPGALAAMNVTLFDVRQKVIDWEFARTPLPRSPALAPVTKTFTVPEGTAFLRFDLSGSGLGRAWFDDVEFRRQ